MDELADELLRMPPQPPQREERGQLISKDEQLEEFDECSYVFTDITVGHNNEVCVLLGSLSITLPDILYRFSDIKIIVSI